MEAASAPRGEVKPGPPDWPDALRSVNKPSRREARLGQRFAHAPSCDPIASRPLINLKHHILDLNARLVQHIAALHNHHCQVTQDTIASYRRPTIFWLQVSRLEKEKGRKKKRYYKGPYVCFKLRTRVAHVKFTAPGLDLHHIWSWASSQLCAIAKAELAKAFTACFADTRTLITHSWYPLSISNLPYSLFTPAEHLGNRAACKKRFWGHFQGQGDQNYEYWRPA